MLMEVYVEYVFLDNFCIDVVLLLLMCKMVRVKPKWWLVVIAGILGTAIAFALPLFSLPIWASIPLKLVLGAFVSSIVLVGQSFLVNFVGYVVFLFSTFVLGGMTVGFMFLFTKNPIESFAASYGGVLPVGLLVAATYFVVQGVLYLVKYVNERRRIEPFLRNLEVQIEGKKIELFGYMDSGNRLEDPIFKKPIVVVSINALKRALPNEKWLLSEGEAPGWAKAHYVDAETATAKGKMLVFEPEFLRIGSIKKKALVGVSHIKFSEVVKVDALFGPALV